MRPENDEAEAEAEVKTYKAKARVSLMYYSIYKYISVSYYIS